MPRRRTDDPNQIMLFADIVPNGLGGFNVIPRKPLREIDSRQAAEILNVCRGSLSLIVNSELGQKHLRWRWLTEKKGKRVFEFDSVIEYREATKDLVQQDRTNKAA
jgi:hypothetical protein